MNMAGKLTAILFFVHFDVFRFCRDRGYCTADLKLIEIEHMQGNISKR